MSLNETHSVLYQPGEAADKKGGHTLVRLGA